MSWIHIDDEVGVLLWALDNDSVSGVVNATAPNPVTNREFSKALGRALGRPAVMPVPGFAVRAMFGARARRDAAKGGARVMPAPHPGPRLRLRAHRPGRGVRDLLR